MKFYLIICCILLISCNEEQLEYKFKAQDLHLEIPTVSTIILNDSCYFSVLEYPNHMLEIHNQDNEVVFKYPDAIYSFEILDFNEDGFEDVRLSFVTNVPNVAEIALFDPNNNTFSLIKNIYDFPIATKIKGTPYYYSYYGNGCADINWDSDLFYLEGLTCYRLANIAGRGCEHEIETGIFIYKVENDSLILIEKELREPGYHHDKYEFTVNYWLKNYEQFEIP